MTKCIKCGKDTNNAKYCSHSCRAKYVGSHQNRTGTGRSGNLRMSVIPTNICPVDGYFTRNKYCSTTCSGIGTRLETNRRLEASNGVGVLGGHKRYIIETRGHKCEICCITEWTGDPVSLVMDHINGNPFDNSLDNLRVICPNCDHKLPTWGIRNKGNGRDLGAVKYGLKPSRHMKT